MEQILRLVIVTPCKFLFLILDTLQFVEDVETNLEQSLRQRSSSHTVSAVGMGIEVFKVATVVEDDKVCLVFALSEEVFTQTGSSADHLYKLDLALYGLEEHKVHDSRNVDAGVKHIHGYSDAEFIIILEFQNEIICIFHVVVDQLAVVRRMIRVQFVEAINDHLCVMVVIGKDDGLAEQFTAVGLDAVLHQFFENFTAGVLVEYLLEELLSETVKSGVGGSSTKYSSSCRFSSSVSSLYLIPRFSSFVVLLNDL